jgi:hypothetical protein
VRAQLGGSVRQLARRQRHEAAIGVAHREHGAEVGLDGAHEAHAHGERQPLVLRAGQTADAAQHVAASLAQHAVVVGVGRLRRAVLDAAGAALLGEAVLDRRVEQVRNEAVVELVHARLALAGRDRHHGEPPGVVEQAARRQALKHQHRLVLDLGRREERAPRMVLQAAVGRSVDEREAKLGVARALDVKHNVLRHRAALEIVPPADEQQHAAVVDLEVAHLLQDTCAQ